MHSGDGEGWRCGVSVASAFLLLVISAPAAAEVGVTGSIFSEARWRGTALSAGHPVAQLDFSYDDPGGFYAGVSASLVGSSEYGVKPLALQENVGFAKRLKSGPAIDIGVINANYSRYTGYGRSTGHSDVYLGVVGKVLRLRHLSVAELFSLRNLDRIWRSGRRHWRDAQIAAFGACRRADPAERRLFSADPI